MREEKDKDSMGSGEVDAPRNTCRTLQKAEAIISDMLSHRTTRLGRLIPSICKLQIAICRIQDGATMAQERVEGKRNWFVGLRRICTGILHSTQIVHIAGRATDAYATRSIPAEGAAGGCMEGTPPADWARGLWELPCGLVPSVMLGWLCMQPGASSSIRPVNRREPWDKPGKKKWEDSVDEVFMEDPRDLPRGASM